MNGDHSGVPGEIPKDAQQDIPKSVGLTRVQIYGAPILVFLSTAAVTLIAGLLWSVGGDRGQGAALALAGAAATHLIKEVHDVLKIWLRI